MNCNRAVYIVINEFQCFLQMFHLFVIDTCRVSCTFPVVLLLKAPNGWTFSIPPDHKADDTVSACSVKRDLSDIFPAILSARNRLTGNTSEVHARASTIDEPYCERLGTEDRLLESFSPCDHGRFPFHS